ncbi:DNA polymerase III subunit delta' [Hoeflea sp. BAL378]|uniref:DNA polymerase III subunit delta' n=1 Tax=Hoeflea sp. BAL378 TaxID=1547437 RepID=UPI000514186C|nr:DNA polymerase III subunit delta' [Hoeflea sp. BAL378]KGF66916.1 DNA polymerase III subunit delta' [Hoeflea sp. BAL378]
MNGEQPGLLEGAIPPETNTALFGHDAAQEFLATAYRSGRMHHAILIEGAEGIGKATLAFRFAHHVLTHPDPLSAPERIADPDPNDTVSRQMASGASHNVLHLSRPVDEKTGKAKSVITVDEVRRAGKFFNQTSGTGNWRIAIIDPADDLNRNAANAILKILEEPPKRSLFLVLSHTPGRLLPTIRSRCLSLRLEPLSPEDLDLALAHLGAASGRSDSIVALSEGSVARALLLRNYGGVDIAEAFVDIIERGRLGNREPIYALAETLAARDRDVAYQFFTEFAVDRVQAMARDAGASGDLAQADRLARLSVALRDHFATAAAYNLDRKQTVLHAFSLFFG